ncbi:DUF1844 domain-containing protein [Pseudobacteriovorax antillogorgiicola]|uniref:DUF1844 domain-containing protein n=1 Tax=Pseudobacteriovorax antillogorgiicola TaxID=1513793 RepID=A0A1Y6B521_9BACT|nr:DUF1844 domain-containing protein [Pseudobacteriovorax antillogorgiicola]TCS59278.1 uncharacterized protein DUF1844 [Pseudobacteriovorax antillogorgiicola]SME89821.1 protein of unknown function [Pseudobacteriovorax antillogorgiicola]
MSDQQQQVEFSGLVLGFCSAALSYMGFGDSSAPRNLALAKQNIDILGLLAEKTKGNLSEEEERLLKDALLDLKTKYTDQQKNS